MPFHSNDFINKSRIPSNIKCNTNPELQYRNKKNEKNLDDSKSKYALQVIQKASFIFGWLKTCISLNKFAEIRIFRSFKSKAQRRSPLDTSKSIVNSVNILIIILILICKTGKSNFVMHLRCIRTTYGQKMQKYC